MLVNNILKMMVTWKKNADSQEISHCFYSSASSVQSAQYTATNTDKKETIHI